MREPLSVGTNIKAVALTNFVRATAFVSFLNDTYETQQSPLLDMCEASREYFLEDSR